jgi:hypothetical protein
MRRLNKFPQTYYKTLTLASQLRCFLIEMSRPNKHGRWIGTEKNATQPQIRSTQDKHDSGRKRIWGKTMYT